MPILNQQEQLMNKQTDESTNIQIDINTLTQTIVLSIEINCSKADINTGGPVV